VKAYLLRVAIALDCFVQAICTRGMLGVTISARAETARYHDHLWGCVLCRFLDWLDRDHCHNARLNDMRRAQEAFTSLRDWR
jgi:hypothetical protein